MTQYDFGNIDEDNTSGTALGALLEQFRDALHTGHMGGTRPAYAVDGTIWTQTGTPRTINFFDGADDIIIGKVDTAANKFYLFDTADATSLQGVPTVKQIQNNNLIYGTTTGSTNAYVLDLGVGLRPTALAAGQDYHIKLNFVNTAAATLAITLASGSNSSAISLKMPDGSDPVAGDLPNTAQLTVRYDGTNFIVMAGLSSSGTFGAKTSLASATTTDLGTISSRNVNITGTTTITGFGSSAKTERPIYMINFAGVLTLTHHATSLIIPGGASVTTAAGDTAIVEYLGSGNWRVREYYKADGSVLAVNIPDDSITLTKLATTTANRVFGTDGSGDPGLITAGTNITISAGSISASGGLTSVHQGDLATSTATYSVNLNSITASDFEGVDGTSSTAFKVMYSGSVAMAGGEYSFKMNTGYSGTNLGNQMSGWMDSHAVGTTTSYVARSVPWGNHNQTVTGKERYVQASPPILTELSENETAAWLYLLLNSNGELEAHYFADVGPFVYNGPTQCMAKYTDPVTKIKYRLKQEEESVVARLRQGKQTLGISGDLDFETKFALQFEAKAEEEMHKAKALLSESELRHKQGMVFNQVVSQIKEEILEAEYEVITNEMKIADINLVPHPFTPRAGQKVVLVGLYDDRVRDLINSQNKGDPEVGDAIAKGYFYANNEFKKTKLKIPGVELVDLRIK